jgi:hypothetical protein
MQADIGVASLHKLVLTAEEHYNQDKSLGIAARMRVAAMKNFVVDARKRAPQGKVSVTLEDYMLLTQFK